MVATKPTEAVPAMAEILSRAFDAAAGALPPAAAELILRARLAEADVERVDQLLEQKRRGALDAEQEALLQDYLQADCVLTVMKSIARQTLGKALAA